MRYSVMRRAKNSLSNDMNLQDKKILITGASSGIGKATAIACAEKGMIVLIHYRDNLAGAKETLKEVSARSKGFLFKADLTREKQIETMFKKIKTEVGTFDLLVNNAGALIEGDFSNNDAWKQNFETNFFSAVHVTQQFLIQKTKSSLNKIVNVTSVYGHVDGGSAEFFAYSAAKAALANMTITLAKLDPNLRVNAVAPGYTMTPMWDTTSSQEKKKCVARTVINRFVAPEEIAQTITSIFENDAITGQIITVDGGLLLKTDI